MVREFLAAELATCSRLRGTALFPAVLCLGGCSVTGAPSFELFGAFFPAWLLCGTIGIVGAGIARVAFVTSGLADQFPYQLALCTSIGVITSVLVWLIVFGR